MAKRIAIIGSTGSIGCQALDVIRSHADQFQVEVLTAGNNVNLLIEQATEFLPNAVAIANEHHWERLREALKHLPVKVFSGNEAVADLAAFDTVDLSLVAIVGFAGLMPTLKAIRNSKHVALANKEALVVAGELVTRLAWEHKVSVLPVDSEHSAIFQCLAGERLNKPERLILTGSGGPFRGMSREELRHVNPSQALQHPTWRM
ncbi:MAG: 1-deoxy-D-xylulose-5-phosphate reductoisomerase, partial [Bacteroidetes bacterium HGW-Bacteroidetes-22]